MAAAVAARAPTTIHRVAFLVRAAAVAVGRHTLSTAQAAYKCGRDGRPDSAWSLSLGSTEHEE
jgi:hypothetical protein